MSRAHLALSRLTREREKSAERLEQIDAIEGLVCVALVFVFLLWALGEFA
jgi:hypothetical protein